ncbi:MAG: redoxin domain-containing protein [Fuerstiella sp.]|nr:redoxin domain-containing protein [Fuerstiella sp.]MCP4855041.1 redoxin domain-containing protein [Fuerstiella sp.]
MELMREVADYAGDLPYRNSTLQARAAGHLNATNLVVGKVAPDMIGHDIDGESFRLSDYRGKIVLLDFWGDW